MVENVSEICHVAILTDDGLEILSANEFLGICNQHIGNVQYATCPGDCNGPNPPKFLQKFTQSINDSGSTYDTRC